MECYLFTVRLFVLSYAYLDFDFPLFVCLIHFCLRLDLCIYLLVICYWLMCRAIKSMLS